jgi:uncharacterized membrane protein YfcA
LIAILIGLAAGFASGLLGVGGGIILVPALVGLAGLDQHGAHATSLAAIVPIAAAGAATFAFSDDIDVTAAILLSIGSLVGAQLGARLMMRTSEALLRALFGLLMLVSAIVMLVR